MTSRVCHGYQQELSQLRSALPILPSTQRPDFQLIFKRLLSKSACLRGSAPDPTAPQTPSWKRLVLTTLFFKSFPRHWVAMLYFDEFQQFPKIANWASRSDFICDLMGAQHYKKKYPVLSMIARFTMYGYWVAPGLILHFSILVTHHP